MTEPISLDHWVPKNGIYCTVCWDTGVLLFESIMYEGDPVCEDCRDYEDLWLSWTEEERRLDLESADRYGDEKIRG
jgi:hypothetical protein